MLLGLKAAIVNN